MFGRKKKDEPSKVESTISKEYETVCVNVTDKMLRVELVEDHAFVSFADISEDGGRIRITSRGILVAEITKRSKAYSELESRIGDSAESVEIVAKDGDYGTYYRIRMKFPFTVVTTE